MPRNGSGTYSLPKPPFVPSTTISSSDVNSDFSDIAAALTGSIAADGQTPITGTLKFTSGTAAAPSHTFSADTTTGMYYPAANQLGFSVGGALTVLFDATKEGTGQDGSILQYGNGAIPTPVGVIVDFAGSVAPSGWLLCYGQSLSQTSYPELYQVIGTTYGSGTGTFNLPDLRGRTGFGKDDMGGTPANRITSGGGGVTGTTLGAVGGIQNITLSTPNLPPYTPSGSVSKPTITVGYLLGTHAATILGFNTLNSDVGNPVGNSFANQILNITASLDSNPLFFGNAQGGTSAPIASLPPLIILNKIIFAGRP